MINTDKVSSKLFHVIMGFGMQTKIFDRYGNTTVTPTDARYYFISKPNILISFDIENKEIRMNKGVNVEIESIKKLIKQIKAICNEYILSFNIRLFSKKISPKDFSNTAERIEEGFSKLYGSKKVSNQKLDSVKIIVKHKKIVDEEIKGARARNISEIFIEQNGERFRYPVNHLQGARALARHMYEGGKPYDEFGEYIKENSINIYKLKDFINDKEVDEAAKPLAKSALSSFKLKSKILSNKKKYKFNKYRHESTKLDYTTQLNELKESPIYEKYEDICLILAKHKTEIVDEDYQLEMAMAEPLQFKKQIKAFDKKEFKDINEELSYRLNEIANMIVGNDIVKERVKRLSKKVKLHRRAPMFGYGVYGGYYGDLDGMDGAVGEHVIQSMRQFNLEENKTLKETVEIENFFKLFG